MLSSESASIKPVFLIDSGMVGRWLDAVAVAFLEINIFYSS